MILLKYNVATTIDGIPLITRGAVDYKVNPTLAVGDTQLSLDSSSFTNITTTPTVSPSGATSVKLTLSAAEMLAKHIVVRFIDQTNPKEWEDNSIIIHTYGHADSQHPDIGYDGIVEGTLTFKQMQRIMFAALAGKSTGGGSSIVAFKDVAGDNNRITATVDANGNRTAITVSGV